MILRSEKLIKKYKQRTVVNEVSVEVNQGEIVGLRGAYGACKTASFYMIVALMKPLSSNVYLDSQNITDYPMYKRAQLGIGYLPQEASVFRKMSVEDNIASVLQMTNLKASEQKKKLESLIGEFGLTHIRKSNGDVLSGGERRRTEIARALATDPKFILLDEPFAGIDPIAVGDIQQLVRHLTQRGIGVLITDHNVRETLGLTDRAYIVYAGEVLTEGTPDEIVNDPDVRRLYLGEEFRL